MLSPAIVLILVLVLDNWRSTYLFNDYYLTDSCISVWKHHTEKLGNKNWTESNHWVNTAFVEEY